MYAIRSYYGCENDPCREGNNPYRPGAGMGMNTHQHRADSHVWDSRMLPKEQHALGVRRIGSSQLIKIHSSGEIFRIEFAVVHAGGTQAFIENPNLASEEIQYRQSDDRRVLQVIGNARRGIERIRMVRKEADRRDQRKDAITRYGNEPIPIRDDGIRTGILNR